MQFMLTSGIVFLALGLLCNLSSAIFLISHKELKKKNICSLKLFLFNVAENFVLLVTITIQFSEVFINIPTFLLSLQFFFVLGQIMAVGLVIVERILRAKVSLTSVNQINRNPLNDRYDTLLVLMIFVATALNFLICLFLAHIAVIIVWIFAVINLVLYVLLIKALSKMKTRAHGAVNNIRRKSLTYVTILFVGFIGEVIIISYRQEIFNNILATKKCQVTMTKLSLTILHIYILRFVYDPVTYFLFNGIPRKLLKRRLMNFWRNFNLCSLTVQSRDLNIATA